MIKCFPKTTLLSLTFIFFTNCLFTFFCTFRWSTDSQIKINFFLFFLKKIKPLNSFCLFTLPLINLNPLQISHNKSKFFPSTILSEKHSLYLDPTMTKNSTKIPYNYKTLHKKISPSLFTLI